MELINLEEPDMCNALAARDVGTVFRWLVARGVTQRELAELVGMSQSEVSAIVNGRRVQAYSVLVRVAEGLAVPRGMMGLAYAVEGVDVVEEVDEEVKRRALLVRGFASLMGPAVVGPVMGLAGPTAPTPLPTRIGKSDVVALRELTNRWREVARAYGGCAEVVTEVAQQARGLLSIAATDFVKVQLRQAVGELHTVAGWCCVDAGLADVARSHFAVAMDLGDVTGALRHAGIQMVDSGAYNDGLKAFQLALVEDGGNCWLHGETAIPLAAMGYESQAMDAVKRFREEPQPTLFDDADRDYVTGAVYVRLGRMDTAQSFVATSVRKWDQERTSSRDRVEADIMLASLHVVTGDSAGPILAKRAIEGVSSLRSVRSRRKLHRLVTALETRRDATSRELATSARVAGGSALRA